jgi:hypothetical protein
MLRRNLEVEGMLINVLERIHTATLEQIVELLPQLSWNEVFHAVDSLSRRGGITLIRRGFAYDVSLPGRCRRTA